MAAFPFKQATTAMNCTQMTCSSLQKNIFLLSQFIEHLYFSLQVKVATLQAKPEQVLPPIIVALSSTALQLTWALPLKPNGFIVEFDIFLLDVGAIANLAGSAREHTLTGELGAKERRFGLDEFILVQPDLMSYSIASQLCSLLSTL